MKPKNALQRWMRVLAGITAVMVLNLSFAQAASAKILFEDDAFFKVRSEGIVLNENDTGAQDVTLKFGNDGTDATAVFGDTTGNLTLSTPGSSFIFADDNTDAVLQLGADGTDATITYADATGDLTILTPGTADLVNLDNATFTATSDAGFDFRSADVFAIRTTASSGADCTYVGELIYDTEDSRHEFCTDATLNTWNSVSAGGTDLQAVYDADAPGAHEIVLDAGGTEGVEIIANANGDQLFQLKSASAAATLASFNDIGGNTLDVNTLALDWDTTGLLSMDSTAGISFDTAGTASNFSLAANGAADDLTLEVTGAFDSSLVLQSTGTGADAIDVNATGTGGGITVNTTDGAFALTTAGAANGDITLTAADVFDIDSVDTLSLNSSAGAINIGNDSVAQNISIGTAGARTLQVGSAAATAANIDAIAFSLDAAGGASNITLASDGAADDLTVAVTGATDSSLFLTSTGTGTDALRLNASAGGIDVDAAGAGAFNFGAASNFTTSSGDITLQATAASANLIGGEAAADAVRLQASNAAGGIDIDAGTAGIAVDSTGAGSFDFAGAASNFTLAADGAADDLTVAVTGAFDSSLFLTSTGTGTDAVRVQASAGGIDVDAAGLVAIDTTGAISLDAAGTASNFSLASDGAADDLTFAVTGATDSSLVLNSSGTGVDAVDINATAGGITIDSAGAFSLDAAAAASNITLAADGAADDLTIGVTGAFDSSLFLTSTGTGTDAVRINASAGGIDIDAAGLFAVDTTGAFSIDGAGTASNITLASDGAADDLTIAVTGATDSSLFLTSTGTGTDALRLQSSAGGIDVDSAGAFDMLSAGAFSIDGTGASNVSATSGNLTLSTITSGNLVLTGAGDVDVTGATNVDIASTAGDITFLSGDDITFDDAQLSALVQLTDTATGFNAEYGTTGIIDAFNTLALFTAGNGADVIGVEDATLTNLDLANSSSVQDALEAIDSQFGIENATLYFQPEFPDVTIFGDGSNNKGTLESFYDNSDNGDRSYYNWTTTQAGAANDISIQFHFKLPADFVGSPIFNYDFRTGTNVEAENDLEVYIYNATNETGNAPTPCASDTSGNVSGTGGVWPASPAGTIGTVAIETGCTGGTALNAGDIVLVEIKLFADGDAAGAAADVGAIEFTYSND